jgi:trehalose synthase
MARAEVQVGAVPPSHLAPVIGRERVAALETLAKQVETALAGRQVLNVNSTATGGGVAELLQTLLAYARGVGIDARWVVIEGDAEFFAVTKRLHDGLYGAWGDGPLDERERTHYEAVLQANAVELLALVQPDDIVLLHDPQTAALAPALQAAGAHVVWRCHVGRDEQNEPSERAWAFLRPYLEGVAAFVVSKASFAPAWVDHERLAVIPPSIDPFSAKNELLEPSDVTAILQYTGLLAGGGHAPAATFTRRDGSPGRVDRHADILQTGPPPPPDAPIVLQASRWDVWKDMRGVMTGFAEHLTDLTDTHLVLAGPGVHSVTDDPNAARVLDECIVAWRALPHAIRARTHLACVPMADHDEAAAIVNALQRHATVVVQKSLAEGFGLTVAEAMWKHRPVIGSAVGGITDQIIDDETGVLLDDPEDLAAFGAAARSLLTDEARRNRIGRRAHEWVRDRFLPDRHLEQWSAVLARLGD